MTTEAKAKRTSIFGALFSPFKKHSAAEDVAAAEDKLERTKTQERELQQQYDEANAEVKELHRTLSSPASAAPAGEASTDKSDVEKKLQDKEKRLDKITERLIATIFKRGKDEHERAETVRRAQNEANPTPSPAPAAASASEAAAPAPAAT